MADSQLWQQRSCRMSSYSSAANAAAAPLVRAPPAVLGVGIHQWIEPNDLMPGDMMHPTLLARDALLVATWLISLL